MLFISPLVCLPVFRCISYSLLRWLFNCSFSFLLLSSGRSFIVLNDSYKNFLSLWLFSPFFTLLFSPHPCLIIHLPPSLCHSVSFHLFSLFHVSSLFSNFSPFLSPLSQWHTVPHPDRSSLIGRIAHDMTVLYACH